MDLFDECEKDGQNSSAEVVCEVTAAPPEYVYCETCGKEYRNTEAGLRWYAKHIEGCK